MTAGDASKQKLRFSSPASTRHPEAIASTLRPTPRGLHEYSLFRPIISRCSGNIGRTDLSFPGPRPPRKRPAPPFDRPPRALYPPSALGPLNHCPPPHDFCFPLCPRPVVLYPPSALRPPTPDHGPERHYCPSRLRSHTGSRRQSRTART